MTYAELLESATIVLPHHKSIQADSYSINKYGPLAKDASQTCVSILFCEVSHACRLCARCAGGQHPGKSFYSLFMQHFLKSL